MRGAEHIGQFENKRLVIRQQICYHTGVKSKGELESLAIAWTPRNQCGPAWSATQSPGLRPTPTGILRVPGEVSRQQMACHFPSLPIAGVAPLGRAAGKEHAYEAVLLS